MKDVVRHNSCCTRIVVPVKIVLRDPPLPFLVMAIVLKVPLAKGDILIEHVPLPPDIERKRPPKPDQWARGASANRA